MLWLEALTPVIDVLKIKTPGSATPATTVAKPTKREHPRMRNEHPSCRPTNRRTSRFYDLAYWFYPLVDWFCRPGRHRLIEQINQEPAGRLLEIGVGPGSHLRLYRRHAITAIDCSAKMVASSRDHFPGGDVRQMDGEDLHFPEASYDYATLFHVLSVTTDPVRMLAEVHRVLRPGGQLFVLNHETPDNAWRHVDNLLVPLARGLCFRSWFRLAELRGVERFRTRRLIVASGFGLMNGYCLEK